MGIVADQRVAAVATRRRAYRYDVVDLLYRQKRAPVSFVTRLAPGLLARLSSRTFGKRRQSNLVGLLSAGSGRPTSTPSSLLQFGHALLQLCHLAGQLPHGAPWLASATVADKASSGAGADARVDVTAGNSGARRDKKGCIGSLYRSWRGPTVHARADSGISKCLPLDIWPISVHYLSPRRVPSGSGRAFCRGHATRRLTREGPRRGGGKRVGSAVHVHRKPDVRVASKGCLIARGYVGLGTPMGRNFPFSPHRIHKARKHTELDAHVGVRRYCVPIPSRP